MAASFGNILVGTQSFVYNIYARNTGAEALTLTSGALSGANATEYGLGGGSCGFYGNSLAPGASCYVQAYLTPAAAGSRTATISLVDSAGTQTIALTANGVAALSGLIPTPAGVAFNQVPVGSNSPSNATGSTQTVTLSGTGSGTPQAALSVTTFAFASDPLGTAEGPTTSILSNSGNGPLQISSIAITGADAKDFLEFDTCVPSVAAGGNCEIAVYFLPTVVGVRTATVTVTDNANNVVGATQTIAVTGTATGIPVASLSGATLSFGTVKVGSLSSGHAITLTNTGNTTLTVSSVALGGTDPGDYSLFNTCGSVTEGSSCVAVVFFKPTATGSRPATLTFTDNSSNVAGSTQVVTLSGTGD